MELKEFSDLGFITALVTLGYAPHERRREGKKVMFVFEYDDNIKQLEDDFFNNRLSVDANKYHMTMKSIKQSIYRMED